MGWVVGVVAVVVAAASYVTWMAGRVDRLHVREASAARAMDAQLVRRAATAAVLAEERGIADLYGVARAVLDGDVEDREATENDLTRILRKQDLESGDIVEQAIVAASRRVALARQVHTDLVRDTLAVRSKPLVRALRMARRHPEPRYFDIDDTTLASVT